LARNGPADRLPATRSLLRIEEAEQIQACVVCLDEHILCCDTLFSLNACRHSACSESLRSWIGVQVSDGATFDQLWCPHGSCSVDMQDVVSLLEKQQRAQLEQQSLELALQTMRDFAWCPRCPYGGLTSVGENCQDVKCTECKYHFCKVCRKPWTVHDGMSCDAFKLNRGDELSSWLDKYTRACPRCEVTIELTQGCSHMTCKLCKHQFCWLCLGDYRGKYNTQPRDLMEKAGQTDIRSDVRCPCGNRVLK